MNDDLLTMHAWTFAFLFTALQLAVAIMVAYLWLIILFFRKGETAVGLLCSLLLLVIGGGWFFGILFALILGWMRVRRWGIEGFMVFWSAAIVLAAVNYTLFGVMRSMLLDEWRDAFGWLPHF